jgi:glycosyltransferase involved in cell wall biosynthesis
MSITGCILAKDESPILEGCLKSLAYFSDEIILVDNGSKDNTVDIAKKFGCKIIESPNTLVDEARNIYLEHAKTDWVFVLDADERVLPEDKNLIINESITSANDIMQIKFDKYNYIGQGRFSIQNSTSRFFRVSSQLRYNNVPIHASIEGSLKKMNGKTKFAPITIHHYDVLIPGRSSNKRMNYYTNLLNHIGKVDDLFQYYGYATEAAIQQKYDSAFSTFEKLFDLAEGRLKHLAMGGYAQLALYINDIDRLTFAIAKLEALDRITNLEVLYSVKAAVASLQGDRNAAIELCRKAVDASSDVDVLLNLASLIDETDPLLGIECIERAMNKNKNLLNPTIYKEIREKNTYVFHSLFLQTYIDPAFHLSKCFHSTGDKNLGKYWETKSSELWNSAKECIF